MPREGEAFDRYRIESVLGEGGMGVVYKAFDPRLNRRVALKVVRARDSDDDIETATGATSRLLREARVAASLDHPNAVAIFDLGEVDGEAFIAMELVSGQPLRASVGDHNIPISTRLRWIFDVARVLSAAHRAGLVHRDVKPENVMIRDDGDVKVLDFGIARRIVKDPISGDADVNGTLSRAGRQIGTPLYMAPEQIRGEPADGRSDQFSWAVMAYELLCGKSPWKLRGNDFGVMAAILGQDPPPLRTVAPNVPFVAAEVITRALLKDPAKRFPTMEGVVNALEPVVGASSSRVVGQHPTTRRSGDFNASDDPMLPFLQTVDTVSKPSAFPEVQKAERARRAGRMRFAAMVAAGVSLLAIAGVFALHHTTQPKALRPVPQSLPTGNGAAAAYAMGLEARRNGMTRVATEGFRRTIALDPNFAPALLRLALLDYGTGDSLKESRDLFQRANVMKATLSDPDRALLEAMAPCVSQDDIVHGECEEKLRVAVQQYPSEMALWVELAVQQTFADEVPQAIATCKEALRVDNGYVFFMGIQGELQAYSGDFDAAVATLDECTKRQPSATGCIDFKTWIHTQRNECAALETDARNWIAAAPHDGGSWGPRFHLANAQIALGRSIEAVEETLRQGWAATSADERPQVEALDHATLKVLSGDFAAAEESIATLEKLAADDPSEDPHAVTAALRVQLDDEEGRLDPMGEVADAFLRRRDGWSRDTRIDDWQLAKDVTMRMEDALLRAGKISRVEYVSRRAAWASKWGKTKIAPYDWFPAYAYWPQTRNDALEALGAMPVAGLPPFHPFVYPEGAMGRLHLLVEDAAGALPLLRHGTQGCFALEDPFATVKNHLWLGMALEKTGDTKGACDAYAFVTDHWGTAKPRSVSAESAKKQAAGLHCTNDVPQR